MDRQLVEKITKEVLNSYQARKGSVKNILAIFMGGDRAIEESLAAMRSIAKGFKVKAFITRAAQSVIGLERIKQSTGITDIILDDGKQNPQQLSGECDLLVIPTLTLNGLSKIANLITDTAHTNIVVGCLERGIPIVVARDAVFCSCYPLPAANSGLYRRVEGYVNDLKNMGIVVTSAQNLAQEVFNIAGQMTKKVETTIGSAGKVFATPIAKFGPIIDKCPAFKDGVDCSSCGLCVDKKTGSVQAVLAAGADRIGNFSASDSAKKFAPLIDHTLLKANATQEEIGKLCEEAKKFGFASVCVNPAYVSLCSQLLRGSGVKVCTVIGFPLGATTPTVKALEARDAIANGADEIDMVINIGALKSGNYQLVLDDIKAVREATRGKILKVILETAYLSREEKIKACELAKQAGADFVKTSTGFGPSGATVEDVRLMREVVGPAMGVKASGGIRSTEDAQKMVAAGATRIGASASVAIVTGQSAGKGKY